MFQIIKNSDLPQILQICSTEWIRGIRGNAYILISIFLFLEISNALLSCICHIIIFECLRCSARGNSKSLSLFVSCNPCCFFQIKCCPGFIFEWYKESRSTLNSGKQWYSLLPAYSMMFSQFSTNSSNMYCRAKISQIHLYHNNLYKLTRFSQNPYPA